MQRKISRRALVKRALVAGTLIPAMGFAARSGAAAALPALDPKDPTAQALGFVPDSTKVDAAAKQVIHPGSLVWVVVGDRAKIEQGIKDLGIGKIHFIDADGKPI